MLLEETLAKDSVDMYCATQKRERTERTDDDTPATKRPNKGQDFAGSLVSLANQLATDNVVISRKQRTLICGVLRRVASTARFYGTDARDASASAAVNCLVKDCDVTEPSEKLYVSSVLQQRQ